MLGKLDLTEDANEDKLVDIGAKKQQQAQSTNA